jgi:hypothetical protein
MSMNKGLLGPQVPVPWAGVRALCLAEKFGLCSSSNTQCDHLYPLY